MSEELRPEANGRQTGQYLTFILREEEFALEITKVREVLDVTTMTRIPRMPAYLSGVINLRGSVVPVMDLGHKLGMEPISRTKNTCIVIAELEVEGTMMEVGLLTDSVQMVLELADDEIEPVPRMGTGLNPDFIKGMGRRGDDRFLILLDIDKVLATEGRVILRDRETGSIDEAQDPPADTAS